MSTDTTHVMLSVPVDVSPVAEEELEQVLRRYLDGQPTSVNEDCTQLEQVTSRHVDPLRGACLLCRELGIPMRLHGISAGLERVLKVLHARHFFGTSVGATAKSSLEGAPNQPAGDVRGTYADEFSSSIKNIRDAQERFLHFLKDIHVPPMTEFELRTVFYEVLGNICLHSGMPSGERIAVSAHADNTKIVLTFADRGIPFDPIRDAPEIDLRVAARGGRQRGFGIAMVRKLTDRMHYVRQHGAVNLLTIEKRWKP